MSILWRSIYEKIWNTEDPETGQMGHPFILRLLCSCDWPDGKALFVDSTRQPVECVREDGEKNSTFHAALMMEFCSMGALDGYIKKNFRRGISEPNGGSLRWLKTTRTFTAEVLLALEYLHSHRIVYRDLKPENVLLVGTEEDTHVKLGDFGFSKEVSIVNPSESLAGSPYFSAPEMYQIAKDRIKRTTDTSLDIFALGMMIYVMLYGCELHRKGSRGWGPVGPEAWEGNENDKTFRFIMCCNLNIVPTPPNLQRLMEEPRCPQSMANVITGCVQKRGPDRLTVSQIKASPAFLEVRLASGETVPEIDFVTLRRMQI